MGWAGIIWAGLGLRFIKLFRDDFGCAKKTFCNELLCPVTVETIELIKYLVKMINCELHIHVYFVTSPISHSGAYLYSLGKFSFRPEPKSDFGPEPKYRTWPGLDRVQASK